MNRAVSAAWRGMSWGERRGVFSQKEPQTGRPFAQPFLTEPACKRHALEGPSPSACPQILGDGGHALLSRRQLPASSPLLPAGKAATKALGTEVLRWSSFGEQTAQRKVHFHAPDLGLTVEASAFPSWKGGDGWGIVSYSSIRCLISSQLAGREAGL